MSLSLKDDILNAVRDFKIKHTCRCKTPKFRKPTVPPQYNPPPMPPVKKPNPKYFPNESVCKTNPPNVGSSIQPPKKQCTYETPCGWCTKWDKKCDKKIGHKKDKDLEDIKSGKGLTSACVFREPWKSTIP